MRGEFDHRDIFAFKDENRMSPDRPGKINRFA